MATSMRQQSILIYASFFVEQAGDKHGLRILMKGLKTEFAAAAVAQAMNALDDGKTGKLLLENLAAIAEEA